MRGGRAAGVRRACGGKARHGIFRCDGGGGPTRQTFSELRKIRRLLSSLRRESEKKAGRKSGEPREASFSGDPADTLATFFERLRDLCQNNSECHGQERDKRVRAQAEQAVALAAEFGILIQENDTWEEFLAHCPEAMIGTEHMVEQEEHTGIVGKTTIPPAFGLIPELVRLPLAVLQPDSSKPRFREAIEFVHATPLEYLTRWRACNEVFGDDVRLVRVIRWRDGLVSFGITQPQYHGIPADPREIDDFFRRAGWMPIHDPSGHTVFFHHVFGVLAIDAATRNCYVNQGGLQPFDVILLEPGEDLERFLEIYPA